MEAERVECKEIEISKVPETKTYFIALVRESNLYDWYSIMMDRDQNKVEEYLHKYPSGEKKLISIELPF